MRRASLALLLPLLTLVLTGCGESDPGEVDLGAIGGKADEAPLKQVAVSVPAGAIQRFRVTATGFRAVLVTSGDALAQLSAKHYELESAGEPAAVPELVVAGDGTVRNWTLRVHNLGTATLAAELRVESLAAAPGGEIGIISDIDKTVLPPETAAGLPPAYPGVAALYTALELGHGGQPGDMFYVTARSPERIPGVPEWMAAEGLPPGPIDTGTSSLPWVAQAEKVADISRIMEARPGQKFVLFGDSNHRDPEVYREVAARYPDRVLAIFIHDVKNASPARVEGMHVIDHYAQAAAILFGQGLLDEAQAREVMKSAVAGGLPLTDADIEALLDAQRR